MIDVHAYGKKWCFEANVAKCAVVVFRNERTFDGKLFLGDSTLPHLDYNKVYIQWPLAYTYKGFCDSR